MHTEWEKEENTMNSSYHLSQLLPYTPRRSASNDSFFVQGSKDMPWVSKPRKRVHIFALGDVGSMLLTGLKLLGQDCIEGIGIYDVRPEVCKRFEFEMNQISSPWDYGRLPHVSIISREQLFKCDVFIFCASLRVPAVGEAISDVRMAQYEINKKLVREIAEMGVSEGFKGLYAQISDPVDPLCRVAYSAGLPGAQVKGFGLGVMNARAAYYAQKEERFSHFLSEGAAFGPHGRELVIADSLSNYNHELSLALTNLAVHANLDMRAIGFKPFIAPAISSGAISLVRMLRGEWHYSSSYMGDIFFGSKCRITQQGIEVADPMLPEKLFDRICFAWRELQGIPV